MTSASRRRRLGAAWLAIAGTLPFLVAPWLYQLSLLVMNHAGTVRLLGVLGVFAAGLMALAFLAMLVESSLTLLAPYLLKVTVDTYITQGDQAGLIRISVWTAATFLGLYLATRTEQYLEALGEAGATMMVDAPWGKRLPLTWIVWHVVEHEIHHRGELSLILGLLGREGLDV